MAISTPLTYCTQNGGGMGRSLSVFENSAVANDVGNALRKARQQQVTTVCPGSSDPPEKVFYLFASENEVYTIY